MIGNAYYDYGYGLQKTPKQMTYNDWYDTKVAALMRANIKDNVPKPIAAPATSPERTSTMATAYTLLITMEDTKAAGQISSLLLDAGYGIAIGDELNKKLCHTADDQTLKAQTLVYKLISLPSDIVERAKCRDAITDRTTCRNALVKLLTDNSIHWLLLTVVDGGISWSACTLKKPESKNRKADRLDADEADETPTIH